MKLGLEKFKPLVIEQCHHAKWKLDLRTHIADAGSVPIITMKFRPCIDIHNGVVKQIVGSTLSDETELATPLSSSSSSSPPAVPVENFVATKSAGEYASIYRADGLTGGHVIMLGPGCERAAIEALQAYPHGLQVQLIICHPPLLFKTKLV